MSEPKMTGRIVKEYLSRFSKTPSLTLAKKIYSENSAYFSTLNAVYNSVRYYRGQKGEYCRKKLSTGEFLKERGPDNPFAIPESDSPIWDPVYLPDHLNNILVFSDMHYPYHDMRAVNAMIEYTVGKRKINTIILNGDIIDCYQLSRFNKNMFNRSFSDELWGLIEIINILQKTFPGVIIYWKLGNHEKRWEQWLRVKAPELLDMEEYKFQNIIKIREVFDVNVIDTVPIHTGRLPWLHGHEIPGGASSPVNPARGLSLKTLTSAGVSHHHRSSAHSDIDLKGKLMSWWSIGCMCDLHPEYAPVNKWNLGFALVETNKLEFEISNMKIYNGKVYRD